MKRLCFVLLIVLLWPWMPLRGAAVESQSETSHALERFQAFLAENKLGTFDEETCTWWLSLPPTETHGDDGLEAIKTGLKLYEAFAGNAGQPAAEPGTMIGVNSASCEFGNWRSDARSADPDPQAEFQVFLTEKELGTFDAETGTWWYQPPQARVAQGEVVNLAYGLEWYKIYADDKGRSPQELGVEIGLSGFAYRGLEMDTGVFFSYFGLDVFRQSEILSSALNQS